MGGAAVTSFFIDTSGRWSGGGAVVLNNLRSAAELSDGLLTTSVQSDSIPLIPRNAPTAWRQLLQAFVWMPQNALPWGPPAAGERGLQRKLRLVSEVARQRAIALVRISSAIPKLARGNSSPVLHNVLDEEFESILANLEPDNTGAFVAVGSAISYRNLSGLALGYALYRQSGGETPMVIQSSGGTPSEMALLLSVSRDTDGLEIRQADADRQGVANLMSGARGLIFPSSVEASPVTLLEAQALGIPIACSNIVAHKELSETDSVFFDPGVTSEIMTSLRTLDASSGSPRHRLQNPDARSSERTRWTTELVRFLKTVRT